MAEPTYKELERRIQELEKAESERNFAEDRLKTIFDNTQDAIFIHDLEGKILDVNDKMCRMYGLTKKEALEVTIEDVSSSNMSMNALLGKWQKVLNGDKLLFEWEALRPKDQSVFNVEVSIQKISFHDKDIVLANVRDITERKRAEEVLREREEKFRLLFNMNVNAMFLVDNNTTQILECNDKASQLFGYSPQELLSMKMTDLSTTPEATRRACQENVSRIERIYQKKDGGLISVEITSEHFYLANRVVHISAIRDITDKKLAEKALREKTQFLHSIIDTTSDLVSVTDLEGNFKFIGPSFIALGYDPDSLVGRNVMEFVHPDDYQEIATAFAVFLAKREDGRKVEYRYRRAAGDYLWFETVGKFILDDAGNPKEILFTSRDFTARKQAEKELKRIEWMLSRKLVSNIKGQTETHDQGYGDLTELNCDGIILKSIGHERLKNFANDYLDLLGTSSAIYEANGDYAFGIFASGWCRMMDRASRKLCHTPDNVKALNSGRWLCHESCWKDCAKEAIGKREQMDIQCNGGIRIYGVPIFAGGNVIGVINFGYGDPPKNPETLKRLADVYHLNYEDLLREATAYDSRPPYIIEMAKKRLKSTATLIGSIVETKQAMESLRDSEEKHRRLFETMAQGIVYQAADGTILSANPAAERILGLSFEQMRGKKAINPRWRMIQEEGTEVPDTDHPAMIALRTGRTVGPVIRGIFHPNRNTYVWLSITVVPLFQPGETKPSQVYATFEDITERKRVAESKKKYEEDLEKRNFFIQTILDNLPIGLAVNYIDEGTATYMNKKFEEIYGWPKQQLKDIKEFFDKIYPDPEYREKVLKQIFDDIKSGDPERMVWEGFEITRQDGKKRVVSAKNIALYEQNFMISTVQDITDNKILQNQLNQAQKLESVGRLAGGVAHDFNNMLGVILGHTELALLKTQEDNDLVSDLIEIQKAAKRSADTTKQLLAFARKEIISPRHIDLNDTVESMLNMLRRLIGEDIDLVWQPAAHLWPVKMDPSQIDQILANLCINARDAISGVGKLTIETHRHTVDVEYCKENPGVVPGDFVVLAVSDNGCGMDKDTLENLFEPFFTLKEVGKGTGLGLATVYGIVKQNNGFIDVYSEPGQGSTFKIYLPRLVADEDTDKAVPEKKTAVGGNEIILLVEDEPTILRMTRMMLERKGYTVISAATPTQAVEKAKIHSGTIDLLMSDVVMPEMNGRDLAGQIIALYPDILILFMSGYTANVIAHQGVLDDGVAFIQKPFSMADMTLKVRQVLDRASEKSQ
jgi:PAS domain S-box-containing protein